MHGERLLLICGLAALGWAAVVAVSGGLDIHTPFGPVSSRNWVRPLVVAALFLAASTLRSGRRSWTDSPRLTHLPAAIALGCAVGAYVVGVTWGTFVAAGPDASGYVSQAAMWRRGEPTMPAADWARQAPWPDAVWTSAPIGYRPHARSADLVPVYSPGLPLVMALFETIGGPSAVFYVVPLFAAAAVWMTFLLGRELGGAWAGAIAAVLLVSSPAFLWMATQPMSDVPAAACWAGALSLALRPGRRSAIGAGAATAVAILIRPNIAPLSVIVAALVGTRGRRLVAYVLAAAPGVLVIAVLNWYWHGAAWKSGYGSFDELYALGRVAPNLATYVRWLADTQTPLVFLAPAAALVTWHDRERRLPALLAVIAFPLAVLAAYLPYMAFEGWQNLRFLLPAYPPLLIGMGVVAAALVARAGRTAGGVLAATLIVAATAMSGWNLVRREGLPGYALRDARFTRAVAYARALPSDAVLLSVVHSGTLHFYSGRSVLRWELVGPHDLDRAIGYLRERGRAVYWIGDPLERDLFSQRFEGTETAAVLARSASRPDEDVLVYELTAR